MTRPREVVPAPQSAQKEDPRAKAAAIANAAEHKAEEREKAKAAKAAEKHVEPTAPSEE